MNKYQETKNRYLKEKVDTVTLRIPKGEKEKIQSFAKSKNKSLNQFILDLITQEMTK